MDIIKSLYGNTSRGCVDEWNTGLMQILKVTSCAEALNRYPSRVADAIHRSGAYELQFCNTVQT